MVDAFQNSLDKRTGLKRIKKTVVLKLFGLGVILPTIDVGSDVYLAINLYLAGHTGWAQATLFPCYINMGFSFLEWLKYEEPAKDPFKAILTLPSVFFQLYPQVRASKIVLHGNCYRRVKVPGTQWMSELEEYEATTAHIEGILEGTTTIFVQSVII